MYAFECVDEGMLCSGLLGFGWGPSVVGGSLPDELWCAPCTMMACFPLSFARVWVGVQCNSSEGGGHLGVLSFLLVLL